MESIRIREELYQADQALTNKLKLDGHYINPIKMKSRTVVDDLKVSKIERDNEVNEIIDLLLKFDYGLSITDLINDPLVKLSNLQKEIANAYHKIIEYVDHKDTLEKLKRVY